MNVRINVKKLGGENGSYIMLYIYTPLKFDTQNSHIRKETLVWESFDMNLSGPKYHFFGCSWICRLPECVPLHCLVQRGFP